MSEKRVGLLISTLPEFRHLNHEIRHLMGLQRMLAEVLPENLANSATVAALKSGELFLFLDNGATAAKLRHMAPRIVAAFQARGVEITGIHLRVQARVRDNPLPQKHISLGIAARAALDALADRLDASPLKSALRRIGR